MINVYMDCEMTGLSKKDELISVGLLYEDPNTGDIKTFYAEFNDYNPNVDNWIKENVIDKLKYNDKESIKIQSRHDIRIKADTKYIAEELRNWIENIDDAVILVADVGHYDIVFLYDIFGGAFNLPANMSATYHDLNTDIANHLKVSEDQAFNVNREILLTGLGLEDEVYDLIFRGQDKHNALYDARVCHKIYEKIQDKKRKAIQNNLN